MLADSKRIITTISIIIFLAGLILFAYLGIYNRYWSDDWCINADLKELGFLNTLKGYTYITTYSSNRFSLIFFSGVLNYLGVLGVQIMTPFNMALLAVSLVWCLVNIKTALNAPVTNTGIFIFILLTLYYSIYLAPNLYQSLYWRSASLPYFAPIVAGALVFALIARQAAQSKPSILLLIVGIPLSFLGGGFSEAGCATLTTSLALYIGITWFHKKQAWAKRSLPTAVAALFSTLLAMAVLIASPTTTFRVGLYGQPASLSDLPLLILKYSSDFVKFSFLDQPLPHLAIAGTAFLLGYMLFTNHNPALTAKSVAVFALLTMVLAFLIIAASYAPSAYIEKVPPHPRTRIIPRFALTMAVAAVSWSLGMLAAKIDSLKRFHNLAYIIFIVLSLYSIRSVFIASRYIAMYSNRAQLWDARDSQIKTAAANGESAVYVQAIDGLPVGGIRDFDAQGQGKPGYWINKCAARYYGIGAIEVLTP